jgi:hypothetical protein
MHGNTRTVERETAINWIDRPPSIGCAAAILWLIVVAVTFSDAGVAFPAFVAVLFGSVLMTGWCLIRASITLVRWRKGHTKLRTNPLSWLFMPLVLAFGFIGAISPLFLSGRVFLSSDALVRSAAVLSSASPQELYANGRWVGLFRVREFSQSGKELRFITNSCGLVDSCGLLYAPEGHPQKHSKESFKHLYGSWWQLEQRF